jgi:hypothetical protein
VRSDLERQAREFAESVQNVLNATICTGIRIGVVSSADTKLVSIGYGVTGICDTPALFPVSLGRKKPRCWLKVGYQLSLGTSRRFLTVAVSAFEVYAATGAQAPLCRFDYERGKSGGYPEAHIQVHGESGALAAWTGVPNTRELERLHLPMGGRRYRVTLEDVIEFLITEKLADTRDGWADVLARHREEWERLQLSAAIRADPDTAWGILTDMHGPLTKAS